MNILTIIKKTVKKVRVYFWYHYMGARDFSSNDKMNSYLPDIIFERDVMLYIIKYRSDLDVYTMTVQPFTQGRDL